jgi:hypothetical protein
MESLIIFLYCSTINKPYEDLLEPLVNMRNLTELLLCIKKSIFFTEGRGYDKIIQKN